MRAVAKRRKRPKVQETPQPTKTPKWNDPSIGGFPLAWRFSICDREGPYNWAILESSTEFMRVVGRLAEFETKSWDQICDAGCHSIECHRMEKPARDRLSDIGQDDVDELMSYRIAGSQRVWCIQDQNIMRILWWDPDHQVYRTEKDRRDRTKRRRRKGR